MNSPTDPFNHPWHILGAGAIGCLWGAHLDHSGHQVTLLLKNRLRLEEFKNSPTIELTHRDQKLSVTVNAELCDGEPTPIINLLVTTKSGDVLTALRSIQNRITEDTRLVVLLNGMGVQQQIATSYPQATLICGTTTDGAYRTDSFEVVHAGKGLTYLGKLNAEHRKQNRSVKDEIMAALQHTGLSVKWDDQIEYRLWYKLAINCVINPLTVINSCRNGDILQNSAWLAQVKQLCTEIEQVMAKQGIPKQDRSLFEQVSLVASSTADNYSSMYQDIQAGRPTEIEQINGYLCRTAEKLSVSVPLNQFLYEQIKALQPQGK